MERWVVDIAREHDREYIHVEAASEDEAIGKAARKALTLDVGMIVGWWLERTDAS